MSTSPLSIVGTALADETRCEILTLLMDGRAHTGGELARFLGVAASTTSEHLSKLTDAGLVTVQPQGRHRYFRLANADVASALEQTGAIAAHAMPAPRSPHALRYARTCYNHLAGELAVKIYEQLLVAGHVVHYEDKLHLTTSGELRLRALGGDVVDLRRRGQATVRPCLDWTERRDHLAGRAATVLLEAMFDRGWIARDTTARSIRVTDLGKTDLFSFFDLSPTNAAVGSGSRAG